MTAKLHPHALLDHALTEAGPLARELLHAVQDELDARPQHFPLREGWRKVRASFVADFEGKLVELLQAGKRGEDPLSRVSSPLGGRESLSLVDEHQALQDVSIAHVARAAEELSRAELHQIGNFFAALRGIARARERDNPLRPALYAHALHHALASSPLGAEAQYELMRIAAAPLAQALNRIYVQACAKLHAAEIGDMVASHGQIQTDPLAHQRLAVARGIGARPSDHGTLDGLSRRVDAANSRPQGLGTRPARDPAAPLVSVTGPDMLSRLYDRILADPRLLPPMKALLARLQIAVTRLARADLTLLRRQDHPTWALLNRVAAHGMAFERADDERLVDFLRFMDDESQRLIDAPTPNAALFEQVLARVDEHIDQQARQSSERNAVALAALERELSRNDWRELLREQIDRQTVGTPMGPRMRRFLQTAWVDVIVAAMVSHGRDSREAQAEMEVVDAVIDSLDTPRDRADREALRLRLPVLIERLNTGCDSIQLPLTKREPALAELMAQHARLLSGLPAMDPAERRAAAARAAASGAAAPASADEIVKRLIDERESQVPSQWFTVDVDRGELPTVPTQLYNEHDSPDARAALRRWVDGLQIGHWFHLFIQGDWHTAQIAWISEGRQYVLFVGRDPDDRLSLTRGALEALLANGLITALAEDSVVQRAVDTLMNDLEDSSG
jgi:hypothetical protein